MWFRVYRHVGKIDENTQSKYIQLQVFPFVSLWHQSCLAKKLSSPHLVQQRNIPAVTWDKL